MTGKNCGLSTSWLSGVIHEGNELLDALGASGLRGLEIDYRVSRETLRQMMPRLRSGEFTVLSLHNYCPTPPGYEGHHNVASLFNPAALDEDLARARLFLARRGWPRARVAARKGCIGRAAADSFIEGEKS